MPRYHFAKLKQRAEQAADSWPHQRPTTAMKSEEFRRYDAAASHLLLDIQRSEAMTGHELIKQPAPVGVAILFRTCLIAAMVARRENTPVEELVGMLRSDSSFDTIETLVSTDNPVAVSIANQIGIRPIDQPVDELSLDNWFLTGDSFVFDNLASVSAETENALGKAAPDAMCPAHKAMILRPLFQSAITICERDKNLFKRSLS